MNTNSGPEELLSVVKQIKEQVLYLQEMGATGIESGSHQALPTTLQESHVDIQSARVPLIPKEVGFKPTTPLPQDTLFEEMALRPTTLAKSGESLEQIWKDLAGCTRCPLHEKRTNIVHTEGNRKARLMFVGEAPGADEDVQARPFVGRAGQLLTKIIEALGLKREEVLIGNVNRCRPPGNRPPMPDEAATCKPFLLREIASVQPEVIVVLGNTAMKNLLGVKEGITRLRGQFQDYQGIQIMPTFHPAYLLRDPSKKRETWEDLKKVKDYLDRTGPKETVS